LAISLILIINLIFSGCGEKVENNKKIAKTNIKYKVITIHDNKIKNLSNKYNKNLIILNEEREEQGIIRTYIYDNDKVNNLEEKTENFKAIRIAYYKLIIEDLEIEISKEKDRQDCWIFCDDKVDLLEDKLSILEIEQSKYDTFLEKNGEIIIVVVVAVVIVAVVLSTGGDGESTGRAVNNFLSPLLRTVATVAIPVAKIAPTLAKNGNKILKVVKPLGKTIAKNTGTIVKPLGKTIAKNTGTIAKFTKANFATMIKEVPNKIGVYVVRKNGKVMYVGRAIEQRKG